MMDVNLNGSFLFAREAGKYWIDQKMKGNLILVSSMSSKICVRPQKQAAYNAVSLCFLRDRRTFARTQRRCTSSSSC